jgi:valyl-tRNA synthetase
MRLLHPIAPFISEEVWLALPHDGETIVTANWPDPLEIPVFEDAAGEFALLQRSVEKVRNLRSEMGLHPRERVDVDVPTNVPDEIAELLGLLAGASVASCAAVEGGLDEALAAVRPNVPRDLLAQRYHKEVARLRNEIDRGEKKLDNAAFVAKAAPDVVAKEREKLGGYRSDLVRVEAALAELKEPA